jgi:quercetin dioxygenase-like cupin family protein
VSAGVTDQELKIPHAWHSLARTPAPMRLLFTLIITFTGSALHGADSTRKEPLPVTEEPSHRTVFENEVVRVIDVQIQPGQRCLFHAHVLPSAVIYLTKSTNKWQTWGETDESKFLVRTLNPGESRYAPYDTQPLTHRVTNTGDGLFRVFDIELLRPAPATPPVYAKLPVPATAPWEEKRARMIKVPLEAGASCTFAAGTQSHLIIGIAGSLNVATDAKPSNARELKWADYRFCAAQTPITVTNPGKEKAEALILELN